MLTESSGEHPHRHAIELALRRWRLRCVFGSWGGASATIVYALELTLGTAVALTATRTPGGHDGTAAASARPRPVGERVSGGVTVPALCKGGGNSRLILAAGGALASTGAADAIFVVLAVGAGVMVK